VKATRSRTSIVELYGERFWPSPKAASELVVPRNTMTQWLERGIAPDGTPLSVVCDVRTRFWYVSESSLEKLRDRFVSIPDGHPIRNPKIEKHRFTTEPNTYFPIRIAAEVSGYVRGTVRENIPRLAKPDKSPPYAIRDRLSQERFVSAAFIDTLKLNLSPPRKIGNVK
jgi:hypothetical protein